MKLVTFNIRCPVKNDGVNYLPNRIPYMVQKILSELPDVIGFQEIEELGTELLSESLQQYWIIGAGRNKDWSGEGSKVAIRKETIHLLAFDQIWLSPTPRIPGSKYESQSQCPRVVLWSKLLHKKTGRIFYFLNTHLDHESEIARHLGLQDIFALVKELKAVEECPVYICGDFNFNPSAASYQLIHNNSFSDLTSSLTGTFHGFGKIEPVKIDYILSDTVGEYDVQQWHENHNGVYLSDHDPVCIDWKI